MAVYSISRSTYHQIDLIDPFKLRPSLQVFANHYVVSSLSLLMISLTFYRTTNFVLLKSIVNLIKMKDSEQNRLSSTLNPSLNRTTMKLLQNLVFRIVS